MASITLKNIPAELHAVLKTEAEANFRSLSQEVMARLQHSLDAEALTKRDQRWVDEAINSGPETKFSLTQFQAALKEGLERAKSRSK